MDVALALIVAAGFVLRLVTLFTVARRNPDAGDPWFYHQQSRLLTSGRGFSEPFTWCRADLRNVGGACRGGGKLVPAVLHPPLFTVWLAISNVVGADSWFAHKVMSCLAGTLTVLFVGLIGREVAGRRAGLIAAGLAAAYPNLWVIDGIGMPEGLYCLTIAFSIWAAYRWWRTPSTAWALALGLGVGLATLTRSEAIFLVPAMLVPLALLNRVVERRVRLRHLGVATGLAILLLVPWSVRNLTTFHDPVFMSTNGTEVLVYANCHDAYHGTFLGFWVFGCEKDIIAAKGLPPGDESQRANYWKQVGLDYARDHAGRLPVVVAARVGRLWDVFRPFQNTELSKIEGRPKWVSTLGLWCYWSMLPFAAGGIVALRRRKVIVLPLLIQAVGATLTAAYAYGVVRLRAPVEVAIVVLAAVAVDALLRRRWPVVPGPSEQTDGQLLAGRRSATPATPASRRPSGHALGR